MRQLTFLTTFVLCIALSSCTSGQESFPDNINVTDIKQLKRVKGSKLFVSTPESYISVGSMVRMQRDNNTYFQILEIPGTNFLEYKSSLTKESFEKLGAKVDIEKTVKYNGYEAIYFSGPSKKEGETKIGLAFGDKDFVAFLVAACQTSDKKANEELKKIISNSYYDKSFNIDPHELASWEFDEAISGFKLATSIGNILVYTPNGKEDLKVQKADLTSFQLSTHDAATFTEAKKFLDNTFGRFSAKEIQISEVTKKDTLINGSQAYEVTFHAKDANNLALLLYYVVLFKGNKAVLFLSCEPENGKWLDKFKETCHSIQL